MRIRNIAVGGVALLGLAPAIVNAVGLGDLQTHSALGEPLRVSVPLKLANGESVRPDCITTPPPKAGDLRQPGSTKVRTSAVTGPGVFDISVTSSRPLYEPMYELTLRVDCPGMPTVMRHYVLMLDLPGLSQPPVAAPVSQPVMGTNNTTRATAPIARRRVPA